MATKLDYISYQIKQKRMPYWLSVLIGLDQFVNTILAGYPDETISSRAYRCNDKWRWAFAERIIDTIFFFDREGDIKHCQLAYLGELAMEQSPQNFRNNNLVRGE